MNPSASHRVAEAGRTPGVLDVTVWHCQVPPLSPQVATWLAARLDDRERARAAAFRVPRDRNAYVAAHVLLQRATTAATGATGHTAAKAGLRPCPDPSFRFSLSHARGYVACATAQGVAVGVDVEAADSTTDFDGVATTYFARSEREYLATLSKRARNDAFIRLWTLKEAAAKATGLGLGLPLTDFTFDLDPFRVTAARGSAAGAWSFAERVPAPGYRAALAVRHPVMAPLRATWRQVDLDALAEG